MLRFESKFIYLTCRPSASLFLEIFPGAHPRREYKIVAFSLTLSTKVRSCALLSSNKKNREHLSSYRFVLNAFSLRARILDPKSNTVGDEMPFERKKRGKKLDTLNKQLGVVFSRARAPFDPNRHHGGVKRTIARVFVREFLIRTFAIRVDVTKKPRKKKEKKAD